MHINYQYLDTDKDRKICFSVVKNMSQKRSGTVIVLQGAGDSLERYADIFGGLSNRGYYVASFDWFGQGQSDTCESFRNKADKYDLKQHINDFDRFLHDIVYPDCPPPYYLLCYDMGCVIGLNAMDFINNQIDRILCVSPLLSPLGVSMDSLWHKINYQLCSLGLKRIEFSQGANNVVQKLDQSGKSIEIQSIKKSFFNRRWLSQYCKAIKTLEQRLQNNDLRVATLFLLANHDKLSSENTAQQMCNNVRLVDYIKISGVEHDILHSADRHLNQFWAVLDAFIPGTRINKNSINY